VKLSGTRWLARYYVVSVILEHYYELRVHFSSVVNTEKCYLARQLSQMLNDETNYLYLKIVKSILYEINQVNLSFQKNNANIGIAYDDLKNLITLLISKILKPKYISNDFDVLLKNLIEESSYLYL